MRAGNESLRPHLEKLIPTSWSEYKTEAIDFSKPFLWFDDNVFDFDRDILRENNALDNLIDVDLLKNPNVLQQFIYDFPTMSPHASA